MVPPRTPLDFLLQPSSPPPLAGKEGGGPDRARPTSPLIEGSGAEDQATPAVARQAGRDDKEKRLTDELIPSKEEKGDGRRGIGAEGERGAGTFTGTKRKFNKAVSLPLMVAHSTVVRGRDGPIRRPARQAGSAAPCLSGSTSGSCRSEESLTMPGTQRESSLINNCAVVAIRLSTTRAKPSTAAARPR